MEYKRNALLIPTNIPIEISISRSIDGSLWAEARDLIYGFEFTKAGIRHETLDTFEKLQKCFTSEDNKLFVFLDKTGSLLTVSVVETKTTTEHIYFTLDSDCKYASPMGLTLSDIINMTNNPSVDELLVSFATVVKKFNEYAQNYY